MACVTCVTRMTLNDLDDMKNPCVSIDLYDV